MDSTRCLGMMLIYLCTKSAGIHGDIGSSLLSSIDLVLAAKYVPRTIELCNNPTVIDNGILHSGEERNESPRSITDQYSKSWRKNII